MHLWQGSTAGSASVYRRNSKILAALDRREEEELSDESGDFFEGYKGTNLGSDESDDGADGCSSPVRASARRIVGKPDD